MRGRAATLAVVVCFLAISVAGCSSDPQAEYCEAVEDHQEALTEVAASEDPGALLDALPRYRELARAAPRDVAGDWDQVVTSLAGLQEALGEAGLDPSSYDASEPPADLSAADRAAIESSAAELGSQATVRAMASLEQHALDVCGTPLSR